MKLRYTLSAIALLGLSLASCDTPMGVEKPKGSVTPGSIEDVRVDNSKPGHLVIRWSDNAPEGTDILYVRAEYHDPYYKKDVVRLGSTAGDSILIPNTYVAGGDYSFKLTPVSSTLNEGTPITISGTSSPVPVVITSKVEEISLSVDDLGTNAQEPSEGPIANAIDRQDGTFFHTAWSVGVSGRHNFQVNLKSNTRKIVRITLKPRLNGSKWHFDDTPKSVEVFVSKDGEEWAKLDGTYVFPKATAQSLLISLTRTDGPEETETYTHTDMVLPEGTQYIRFDNVANQGGKAFFNFSEIYVYDVDYITYDREAEGKAVIEGKAEPKPNAK